jgi:SPOR domain
MQKLLMGFLVITSAHVAISQTVATPIPPPDTSTVIVHKDLRIDLLIKKQAQINEETARESRRTMRGYRLMVINTNKRDEAIAAKTKIYTYFPELKAYLLYQSPYFKLKAGNFKTRDEAEDYQKKLNAFFPKGVFIISDIIEIKPEKAKEGDDI